MLTAISPNESTRGESDGVRPGSCTASMTELVVVRYSREYRTAGSGVESGRRSLNYVVGATRVGPERLLIPT